MFKFARVKKYSRTNMSQMSPFWQKSLGSCHALWWEDDEKGKGGAKTALMGNREFRKDPKRLSWRRKLGENIGMCTIISPFSIVCRFNEGGAKSLKGQDNRKGYSFQLQTKPALCVNIVYTYQYIDICRASYLYIPITYIVYGTKVL